ncbi:unnamed protein product [Parajaminaea phylloscopi]
MSALPSSFPYYARATKRYRSPHAQDLSFAKGVVIRVLSAAPKQTQDLEEEDEEDEEDVWLVGELRDGTARGTFPSSCVEPALDVDDDEESTKLPVAGSKALEDSLAGNDSASRQDIAPPQELQQNSRQDVVREQAAVRSSQQERSKGEMDGGETGSAPTFESDPPTHSSATEAAPKGTPEVSMPSPSQSAQADIPSSVTPQTTDNAPAVAPAPLKSKPPPPKPKPSGLAARIAAFNQPQNATPSPPLPRGGRINAGSWKRTAEDNTKATDQGKDPKNAETTPAVGSETSAPEPTERSSRNNEGFSAADAASSIKMSLKERMAALQKTGSETSRIHGAGPEPPHSKPSREAGRPDQVAASGQAAPQKPSLPEDERQGLSTTIAAQETATSGSANVEADAAHQAVGSQEANESRQQGQDYDSGNPDGGLNQSTTIAEDTPERAKLTSSDDTPGSEDQEAQRRAAIAQRMARLGGQRFGGGAPALFGAPPPPRAAPTEPAQPDTDIGTGQNSAAPQNEARPDSAQEVRQIEPKSETEMQGTGGPSTDPPATLSVPRRTAPPRKKRSALASPIDDESQSSDSQTQQVSHQNANPLGAPDAPIDNESGHAASPEPLSRSQIANSVIPASDDEVDSSGRQGTDSTVGTEEAPDVADQKDSRSAGGEQLDLESSEDSSAHPDCADGETEILIDPDEALQRQTDQLNSFLRDPSRQNSVHTVSSLGAAEATTRADNGDDTLDQESSSESGNIPSALARQLGLTPSSERGPHIYDTGAASSPVRSAAEQMDVADGARSARFGQETPSDSANVDSSDTKASSDAAGVPSEAVDPDSILESSSEVGSVGEPNDGPSDKRMSLQPPARDVPTPPVDMAPAQHSRPTASAPSRPPIPMSPPPRAPSAALSGLSSGAQRRDSVVKAPEPSQADEDAPPVLQLAAPKPMHAIAFDDGKDDEDTEHFSASDDAAAPTSGEAVPDRAASASDEVDRYGSTEAREEEADVELTPEQEAAARRAAIAKRMAALGGQRMGGLPPIMGAPMPPRRKLTSESREPEEQAPTGTSKPLSVDSTVSTGSESFVHSPPARRGPPPGGMAIPGMTLPQHSTEEQDEAPRQEQEHELDDGAEAPAGVDQAPAAFTEPRHQGPPKPTSPPPVPMAQPPKSPPPRPPSAAASEIGESIKRRSSVRPPIPSAAPSPTPRSVAHFNEHDSIEQSLSKHSAAVQHGNSGDQEPIPRVLAASPPVLLPTSPPPAPPRAMPPSAQPPAAPVQPTLSDSSEPTSGPPAVSGEEPPPRASLASRHARGNSQSAQSSARDLDLNPASRWWRQQPLRLPSSITGRSDLLFSVDHQPGSGHAVIKVLFEDYAMTTVHATWDESSVDEHETLLEQAHDLPPSRPAPEEMQSWASMFGVDLAKEALLGAGSKTNSRTYSSSYALCSSLVAGCQRALPPVGSSFGCTVLSQVGSTILDRGPDDTVRVGDIVQLQGADFKGKKGLGSYHSVFGSAQPGGAQHADVHSLVYGVIVEVDAKKRRWRIITTSAAAHPSAKATSSATQADEVTLRLDDLRGGLVKVMRVTPRGGWVRNF